MFIARVFGLDQRFKYEHNREKSKPQKNHNFVTPNPLEYLMIFPSYNKQSTQTGKKENKESKPKKKQVSRRFREMI